MRNKTAILGFVGCAVIVLIVEALFLSVKVQPIDSELYARGGVDIEIRDGWRFGFLRGMHGALLVKTPDTGQSLREPSDQSRELFALMGRELRQIPLKVTLETALYMTILGFVFFIAPALRRAVRGPEPGRARGLAGDLLAGALVFGLSAAPLLVLGYGYGGFSNLVGPGAFSYSGPYFHWWSWIHNSSNSISYRAFVSPLTVAPGVLVQVSWLALRQVPVYGQFLDDEPDGATAFWIAGALFYGVAGALLIRLLASFRRRQAARADFREARRSI